MIKYSKNNVDNNDDPDYAFSIQSLLLFRVNFYNSSSSSLSQLIFTLPFDYIKGIIPTDWHKLSRSDSGHAMTSTQGKN